MLHVRALHFAIGAPVLPSILLVFKRTPLRSSFDELNRLDVDLPMLFASFMARGPLWEADQPTAGL